MRAPGLFLALLVPTGVQEPAPDPAHAKLLAALPVPARERIGAHADRAAILAGTAPLDAWRLHAPPDERPPHPVGGVAFADHGRDLLACGSDGTGKRFTVATGAETGPLTTSSVGAHAGAFAPRGQQYATGGADGRCYLWSDAGRLKWRVDASEDALYAVAFHPSGKLVACCGLDGRARVFDGSGKARFDFAGYGFGLRSCAFTPDGRALITGGRSEMVEWWDVAKDTPVRQVKVGPETTKEGEDFVAYAVAPSPDSKRFAAAGSDGRVRVHEWMTGHAEWSTGAHEGGAFTLAWHPELDVLASGGAGGAVRLWKARDGATLRTLQVDAHAVYGVALSPKAPLLATVGSDGVAKLWVVPELLPK